MAKTDDIQSPDLGDIVVAKNKEDYLVKEDDDWQDMTRPVVRLLECPFSPCVHPETGDKCEHCSKQSWSAANVWSLDGPSTCIGYLMHHGMYSKWHGMDRHTCFDSILSVWNDLKLEYYEDTFAERQHYRDTLEHIKQSKVIGKAAESVDKSKGNGNKRKKEEDQTEDMVSRKEVTDIVMQTLQHVYQEGAGGGDASSSSSESPWAKIQSMPRPPIAAPNSLLDLTADSSAGTRTLSLGAKTVTIPIDKLKLMQDSLQRAEHAITSSLTVGVEQSNKLAHERLIVLNAIDVISGISGVATAHFGHMGQ